MINQNKIHPLAAELNNILDTSVAANFLSSFGKRIYFPKGIIAQSGEARELGHNANATIGMAFENGKPLMLSSLHEQLPLLTPQESVAYAPTAGNENLRKEWKNKIIEKNPSLKNSYITLPVLVPGLTAGINYLSELFLDEQSSLITGLPAWDNYSLIIEARKNSKIKTFTMFNKDGFNLESFNKVIEEESQTGYLRLLLNFPQNPSGYSLTKTESKKIIELLLKKANENIKIMVWCDDAYFGLNYEDSIETESIFAKLANLHKNIFAIKIDGPTKEDYVWGLRTGFLTFASKNLNEEQGMALIKKLMGAIRSSVSCSSTPSQSLMLKILNCESTKKEKKEFKNLLQERYRIVRNFIDENKDHDVLEALPFNSGYFMCMKCKGIDAEKLRINLLKNHGIGTIAIDSSHLRVAFSSVDTDKLIYVYKTIFKAAEDLLKQD